MFFLLAGWAGLSWLTGLLLLLRLPDHLLAQAAAAQCIIWGVLNSGFGLFGLRQAHRADRAAINPTTIQRELADRERLIRLLQFSARVSLAFLALAGLVLAAGLILRTAAAIGHGAAMVIQTTFLCFFDRTFLARLTLPDIHAQNQADNPTEAIDAPGSGR